MLHTLGDTILTPETAERIAQRLRNLLTDKPYTTIICDEYFDFCPEVRAGQHLEKIHVTDSSFILLTDSYGVYTIYAGPETFIEITNDLVRIRQKPVTNMQSYWLFIVNKQ
jgi:hypothetical protein